MLFDDGSSFHTPRDWFEPAITNAELKNYTWHCNLHGFASILVMAGVDIRTVAQLPGHSTIQMTVRYSHLAQEQSQTSVEQLVSSRQMATKSATTRKTRKIVRA